LLPNNSVIAVDRDRDRIRVLHFVKERSGGVRVLKAVSETITEALLAEDAETVGTHLKTFLQKHDIRASMLVFAMGRERSFLHALTIPASPEDQVANLVRFQLAQELPFAIEESVVDYIVTARNEEGKVTGVLAAAVRREHVDFLQHVAKTAGLKLAGVGLKPYANLMAVRDRKDGQDKVVLFMDLGRRDLEIDVFSPTEGIAFSRSVGLDEASGTSPLKDLFLEQGILQLKRTLHAQAYLAGSPKGSPQEILISGSTGWEDEFAELAGKQLSLPTHVFRPAEAGEHACTMVGVYGLACGLVRPRQEQFNFLRPKRAVDPQAVRMRYIQFGVAAFALLMIIGFLYSNHLVAEREEIYKAKAAENVKLKEKVGKFKNFANQANGVQAWLDRKVNWLDQLQNLTELLPTTDKAYVGHVFLAEGKGSGVLADISLEGMAKSRQVIDEIAKTLVEKGKLKVVPGQVFPVSGEYSSSFKFTVIAGRSTDGVKGTSTVESPKMSPKLKVEVVPTTAPKPPSAIPVGQSVRPKENPPPTPAVRPRESLRERLKRNPNRG